MATSLKIVLGITAIVAALGQTCSNVTAGKCNVIDCFASRGPVVCVGSFLHKVCVCEEGYCATADMSKCVWGGPTPPPRPTPVQQGAYPPGTAVQVRDLAGSTWISGTVISDTPEQVKPHSWSKKFAWKYIMGEPPMFTQGVAVEARDVDGDDWKTGKVTSLKPLQVKLDGWQQPFAFHQVRRWDWKSLQAAKVATEHKAFGELSSAAQTTAADAASARKDADQANVDANQAAEAAASAKKSGDEAAAKARADAANAKKKEAEQTAADKAAADPAAKLAAARGAATEANNAREVAATTAANKLAASNKAAGAAAKAKKVLLAEQAAEKTARGVAEDLQKQVDAAQKAGHDVMAKAMSAAHGQAVNNVDTTHKLVMEYQDDSDGANRAAADTLAASNYAHKVLATKQSALKGAEKEVVQQVAASKMANDAAAAAKKNANSAVAAAEVSAQDSVAKTKAAAKAASFQKAAEKIANAQLQVQEDTNAVASDAKAKSRAAEAAGWSKKPMVQFLADAVPSDETSSWLIVAGFASAMMMMMIAVAVWRGVRTADRVVMPESMLG